MKRYFIAFILLIIATVSFAGDSVTLPYYVTTPDTDQAERVSLLINFSGTINYPSTFHAIATYQVWNSTHTKIQKQYTVTIEGPDFISLFTGIGATLNSRIDAIMSQDLQTHETIVAK